MHYLVFSFFLLKKINKHSFLPHLLVQSIAQQLAIFLDAFTVFLAGQTALFLKKININGLFLSFFF